MTKYTFYPKDLIDGQYDYLKKNFHNLLLYYNPNQYLINKELASKNYEEILNLYKLFNSGQRGFEAGLILNRINRIIYHIPDKSDIENNSISYVTLEQLYKNSITIKEECKRCFGIGLENIQICGKCEGNKRLDFVIYNQYNVTARKGICDECNGKGMIGFGGNCGGCYGLKFIPVPADIDKLEIKGDVITIEKHRFYLQPDPQFSKKENDLIYNLDIPLSELINGFQYKINLLNRTQIILKSKEMLITDPKKDYIIPNLGFITKKGVGNLIIRINVIYPKTLQEFHLYKGERYHITEKYKFIDIFEI